MLIKNVVFDFGGVLVDWNPDYLLKDVFDDKAELEYFLEYICNPGWTDTQDADRPLEDTIDLLQQRHPKYHDEIRLYYDEWTTMLGGPIAENVALLEPLRKHYSLFGLTNWSAETFPIAYDLYPFFGEFEGIVISGIEKLTKPDPRIYRVLLDRYQLTADECLFIDDRENNIQAANALGFHTIHLKPETSLKDAMLKQGIQGLT